MTEVMTPWVHSEWEALGEHEWWQWQEWLEPEGEWEDDPVQHDAPPADHLQHDVAPPADLQHDVAPSANAHADAGGPAAPPDTDELME